MVREADFGETLLTWTGDDFNELPLVKAFSPLQHMSTGGSSFLGAFFIPSWSPDWRDASRQALVEGKGLQIATLQTLRGVADRIPQGFVLFEPLKFLYFIFLFFRI